MIKKQMSMQLGKQGVTDNFMQTLNNAFKAHNLVRISALQASGRDRNSIVRIADELIVRLDGKYAYTILGFTIIIKKQ